MARGATGDDGESGEDRSAPWMGEVTRIWREAFGGRPPAYAVRVLRPVVKDHGEAEMLARLAAFCRAADPRYVDLHRFATTPLRWGAATPGTTPGAAAPITPARLRELVARHSLGRPGVTPDAYWEQVDDACPEELDGETWRALVLHVQPWELAHLTHGRAIEEQLASRLATWRGPAAGASPAGAVTAGAGAAA